MNKANRNCIWICNVCNARNHEIDGECQYCECGGRGCKRDNCSGDHNPGEQCCDACGLFTKKALTEVAQEDGTKLQVCPPCLDSDQKSEDLSGFYE